MQYLFILGRNIELSKLELYSYFRRTKNKIISEELNSNGFFVELENPIKEDAIKDLGGVLRIGKVIASSERIEEELDKYTIYSGESNKLNYVLWEFSKNSLEVENYLKLRFKSEKLKAVQKHLTDRLDMQNDEEVYIPSSKLLDFEYFVFENKGVDYFGKINQFPDYEKIEERDMEKPVRRESLAIAPRLAKILINLAEPEEILLDPFCGVGTVLQEALLQKIKVVGVDRDKKATEGAEKNLEWFKFSKENYQVINFDSIRVSLPEVSAIATEPDLGKTLRKTPQKHEAEKTLLNFEKLMVQVINNLKKKVSGRVVFTSPNIRVGKKRLSPNIENICERTGYEVMHSIPEFRKNQVVGRMIYVLEKNS